MRDSPRQQDSIVRDLAYGAAGGLLVAVPLAWVMCRWARQMREGWGK